MPLMNAESALNWFHQLARENIITQSVTNQFCEQNNITWDVLRTDLIHSVCSGNKFFKLRYYLEDALRDGHSSIQTWGGPWSNHLVATAFAAQACGLGSTGYVRGEEPAQWSSSLLDAASYGMHLVFLSRKEFDHQTAPHLPHTSSDQIPMGGYGLQGAKGASEILRYAAHQHYTHIFCAAGTGTMAAGLAMAATNAEIWAVNMVKDNSLSRRISALAPEAQVNILENPRPGGYAKTSPALMDFMNRFYLQNSVPTDFVYTGRLMLAIEDLLLQNALPRGSRILAIHSGGLIGNKSLKNGQLHY